MPASKHNWILLLFGLAAIANLFAEFTNNQQLVFISKPLLMLTLAAYFYLSTPASNFRRWILFGIIFALFGDVFLMLNGRHGAEASPLFMYGLGSFLLTHLFYTIAFRNYKRPQKGLLQVRPIWLLPFVIYFILFWMNMRGYIGSDLLIPVIIYSSVIVLMAMAGTNLSNKIPKSAANLILIGIFLFVFSDTCIAINKFTSIQIPKVGIVIMLTYILGQLGIVLGATKVAQVDA